MTRTFGASLLAMAAGLIMALPAAAREPVETTVTAITLPNDGWTGPRTPPAAPAVEAPAEDEIVIACLRLPTLADLSKERWNDVHRRYPGRRGQPIRRS